MFDKVCVILLINVLGCVSGNHSMRLDIGGLYHHSIFETDCLDRLPLHFHELFVHVWCFRWLLSTAKVDFMLILPYIRHVHCWDMDACSDIVSQSCRDAPLLVKSDNLTSEAIILTATILAFDYLSLDLGSFFIFFFVAFICSSLFLLEGCI